MRSDTGHMGRIARTLHHFGERGLFQPRAAALEQALGSGQGFRQTRGYDHEAEPKPSAQRARESAKIDRAVGRVRRDCLHRRAFEPQLAVRIVFENVTAAAPRPGRDRVAPLGRQHVPRRELVRGRQVQERGWALWQSVGHQALCVHATPTTSEPVAANASAGPAPHGSSIAVVVPRCRKSRAASPDAFPHPRGNEYPRRIRDDAAGCGEMGGDGGSQRGRPASSPPSVSPVAPPRASCFRSNLRQALSGKSAGCGRPGAKSCERRPRRVSEWLAGREGTAGSGIDQRLCVGDPAGDGSGCWISIGAVTATNRPDDGRDSISPSTINASYARMTVLRAVRQGGGCDGRRRPLAS
jgi:hypothetical protein